MNTELFKRITFDESDYIDCFVLFFDLEDFSEFVLKVKTKMKPIEVKGLMQNYLKHIFSDLNKCIHGGDIKIHDPYWLEDNEKKSSGWKENDKEKVYTGIAEPNHLKFQGDGALYVWEWEKLGSSNTVLLIERLLGLRKNFSKVMEMWLQLQDPLPRFDIIKSLPPNIRFGLSKGPLVKLAYKNNPGNTLEAKEYFEYVGYDVNLAARLQGYCKKEEDNDGLGFIASDRLPVTPQDIEKNGLLKVRAISLKGCDHEDVLVVKSEYNDYKIAMRKKEKFVELS